MNLMDKMEMKFGRNANRFPNLIYIFIGCYAAGYLINRVAPQLNQLLSFHPLFISQGQIWRLITWIISNSSSSGVYGIFMIALTCFIYISIGKTLEQVIGRFRVNFFLISGMIMTEILGLLYFFIVPGAPYIMTIISITPFYMYATLFILFAMMYPDAQFRLFFIIPVRGKWMVFITLIMYAIDVVQYFTMGYFEVGWLLVFEIAAAVLNVVLYMLLTGQRVRRANRRNKPVNMQSYAKKNKDRVVNEAYRHKCAVCGRTEKTNPELEFRYCTKCNGNHEYCMDHLYTHIHTV